jgi:TPR repeat protein
MQSHELKVGLVLASLAFAADCGRGKTESVASAQTTLEKARHLALGRGTKRNPELAAQLYEMACEQGQAEACTYLGASHLIGEGVPTNLDRAASLFRKACDGSHHEGCTQLGLLYIEGKGVPHDVAKAAALLDRACALGKAPTPCTVLAQLIGTGDVAPRDPVHAAALYARACELGDERQCPKGHLEVARSPSTGMP